MPPKLLAKPDRASGVLPINAATRAASNPANKQPSARLKLEVRRLPPGLTVAEFEETLGDAWKPGNGKVDWREYRGGKIRALSKLPEQSRCYLHLVNEACVKEFEQLFLAVVFQDKAGTHRSPDLKHLPPTLGYAPNQRVPIAGKQRPDNRQGTIDQDPEFIAFLEAETQPVAKPVALDAVGAASKDDSKVEVKSTPLIDDLREKKANKAKIAASKAEKKAASKSDNKDAAVASKDTAKTAGKSDGKKVEQAAKEIAKIANKQVAAKQTQPASQAPASSAKGTTPAKKQKKDKDKVTVAQASPKPAAASPAAPANATTASPAPQRMPAAQRAKRDTEGIKKMLQKDLGIKPKDGSTPTGPARLRQGTQQSAAGSAVSTAAAQTPPSTSKSPATQVSSTVTSTATAPTSTLSATAPFKAFLKHANPSQGMTEVLIREALAQHSDVESVAIDPRKGTAIAVFKTQEALQKAIQVRKVNVASGAVEVLEFRDRAAASSAGTGRGGSRAAGRGGRGRGASAAAAAATVAPATARDTPPG